MGAFKVLAGSAITVGILDALKNILKEKGFEAGTDFIKSLASGKGLENEAIYGLILDSCNLTTIERSFIIRAIQELRTNGTEKEQQAANNFIILVALGVPDVKTRKRPGEKIIHGFIHRINEYATDDAKVQMIKDNIIHIGTDAQVANKISQVQEWALMIWEKIKPIGDKIDSGAEKLGDGISSATKWVDRQYDERLARAYLRATRRKANGWNWLNPRLWFEQFIDLR
jgi:hypothetical protein